MHKTANYRKAIWANAGGSTLAVILKDALASRKTPSETKFEYQPGVFAHIAARNPESSGVYFTIYAEGRRAGTVESGGAAIRRRKAPDGEEFLRTGVYLVVQGNHLCFVADGHTNDGQITGLLHKFFKHAGRSDSDTQFGIFPKADRKQIANLLKSGVKSIDLGMTSFLASVREMNNDAAKSQFAAVFGPLVDSIRNIGAATANASEVEALSDIEASIHLGYDGRSAHQLVPKILSDIAEGVATSDDDFLIVTRDDNKISRKKLVIRKEVHIAGDDIALLPESAFSVLSEVMKEWKLKGVFDV